MDLNLEIRERKTGGLSAGGGISATGAMEGAMPGVVGEVSYSQRNLFGLGQRLVASAKLGQVGGQGRVVVCRVWDEWMDRQRDAQLPEAAAVCFVKMKEASSAFLALIMLCHAASRCALLQTDAMFRVQHTDPWVRGDAHRTSRTTTIQVSVNALL